ncbi:MAG: DUF4215 domain-containing protein [Polyangiales bacterium]
MRVLIAIVLFCGCAATEETPAASADASSADAVVDVDLAETVADVMGEHAIFETEAFTCGNGTIESTETCDDGNQMDGDGCSSDCHLEGCADGKRVGFLDAKAYPNIAACGTEVEYPKAVADAATVCQTGWHICSLVPKELDTHLPGDTAPAEKFRAWMKSDDASCTLRSTFPNTKCSGDANGIRLMQGTGACATKLACPVGYRAMLDTNAWNVSLSGSGCNAHVSAGCGYPGGAAVTLALTLCCR